MVIRRHGLRSATPDSTNVASREIRYAATRTAMAFTTSHGSSGAPSTPV